uniref:hypothetical protein n=1 Tax=Paractinoplanes polyasparticus TaxID=2856853 RepID=UPI001C841817|nr:hypothetical protein [Actinoplanes polyasparticus]
MNAQLSTTYVDFTSPTGSRLIHARIDRHHDGVAITVAHVEELDRTFATPAAADAYLNFLQAEVEQGTTLYDIVQAAGVLTSAAAVFDELAAEVLDNAQPATLDTFRQASTRRAAITTEPQDRVLAQADDNGYIRRGKTATIVQLNALERCGLVKLDRRKRGRHWVTFGATLTAKAERRVAA